MPPAKGAAPLGVRSRDTLRLLPKGLRPSGLPLGGAAHPSTVGVPLVGTQRPEGHPQTPAKGAVPLWTPPVTPPPVTPPASLCFCD